MNIRKSNLELMRCVSLLMVLMVHCVFSSNGFPSIEDTFDKPFHTFYYSFMESLGICCVDCFILISGYFGIKTSWKKVLNIFLIFVFWKISIYLVFCILGYRSLNLSSLYQNIKPTEMDWFVYAYFGLMFMAPILNAWFDNTPKKQLYIYTLVFFTAMMLSTITECPIVEFKKGYSAVAFCGIYMLGRIYRRDIESRINTNKSMGLLLYLSMATIGALWFVLGAHLLKDYGVRGFPLSYAYSSPIVIIQALGVLILFSNLQVQSRVINVLGASAFSVYLIHGHQLIFPFYMNLSKTIYGSCGLWLSLPAFIIFIIVVYITCCILDQIRVFIFDHASKQKIWIPSFR